MGNQREASDPISAAVTVSTTGGGSTTMTAEQFIQYLRASDFVGNMGSSRSCPGDALIKFANGI